MDEAGPQSLFVVASYGAKAPPYFSILRFETQVSNHDYEAPEQIKKTEVDTVVRINQRPRIPWLLSPPTSNDDLYMVPHRGYEPRQTKPLHGYKFNFRTGMFQPIKPPSPMPSTSFGRVVNLRGKIFFMAHEWRFEKQSVFQCYNPQNESWRALEPLPNSARLGPIVGTAVWGDDTILFNVDSKHIWAYVVSENKWYPVGIDDFRCVSIAGEAVFVKDIIYALSDWSFDSVLALSIVRGGIEGHHVFRCSLKSVTRVKDMQPILFEGDQAWQRSRHLVHLREDNFCVVQSCGFHGYSHYQPVQLTYIKLMVESSKTVLHEVKKLMVESSKTVLHEVKIENDVQFRVRLCFSLPQYRTTGLKEGKRLVFNFNPFAKDYASKPVQEQGHLIYVRKLPCNATVTQVEQGFSVFGPIKRDGIQVRKTKKGIFFAFVKFESATSKHRAIEASTIFIGECQVEISSYCSRTSKVDNSSFGKNEFKDNGEVSRSKV